eukprot:scaffold73411_cov31-Tisochrysis_lutea.AAC.3
MMAYGVQGQRGVRLWCVCKLGSRSEGARGWLDRNSKSAAYHDKQGYEPGGSPQVQSVFHEGCRALLLIVRELKVSWQDFTCAFATTRNSVSDEEAVAEHLKASPLLCLGEQPMAAQPCTG